MHSLFNAGMLVGPIRESAMQLSLALKKRAGQLIGGKLWQLVCQRLSFGCLDPLEDGLGHTSAQHFAIFKRLGLGVARNIDGYS